jgi:hypothetical protein
MCSVCVCVYVCVCVRFSVFVYRYRPCDELITRPRSPTNCLRPRKPSETESFMEVGQGPNCECEWILNCARSDLIIIVLI